jgi:hypothetical protein
LIPNPHIQAWIARAPWTDSRQTEQDSSTAAAPKNRDLFDLHHGLELLSLDAERVLAAFHHYIGLEGVEITRAHAEERMLRKLTASLTYDIAPLLAAGISFEESDALIAFENVWRQLIQRLPVTDGS